jgi:hypothetical protein
MEMHNARACVAQDGTKAFGSDLVWDAVREIEPAAPVASEAMYCQAIDHILALIDSWSRNGRWIPARHKKLRQATDIHFCSAACIGEESVGHV